MFMNKKARWETEDATLFRDMLRQFLLAEAMPNDGRWRQQKYVDRSFWRLCGEMGFLCPSIPEAYGGGGGGFELEAVIQEELGFAGLTGFVQSIHGGIVAHYLLAFGNEEQKHRWLPKLCSGEWIGAIGMTEPGGGSDLKAARTTAIRDGDCYRVNGAKTFITNGQQADLLILAVKTDPGQGSKGMTLLVVETHDQAGNLLPGFERGRNLEKLGMHASDTAELFFSDMLVPVENRLREEGKGFAYMMEHLPQERLLIALGAQAMMERGIELTIDYVGARKAFGGTLADLQHTRFTLAECVTQAYASRALLDNYVELHCRDELSSSDASMIKYLTTDNQFRVLDQCVQLHGGYGYMEEYPIARMYIDSRVQRVYGGANEIMKEMIARAVL